MPEENFYIGCHLSFADGYKAMADDALSINANAFQYFSRNPRGGKAKDFDSADAQKLIDIATQQNFAPFLVHAPYTYNLCSKDESVRQFATRCMLEDLQKQQNIPNSLYNFHPGSHVGQGTEMGISLIVQALDSVMSEEFSTTILLEAMAGKGSELGGTFEELAEIIKRAKLGNLLGVCLDTCHIYSAGYDIVNDLDGVLEKFDSIVGLSRLKAIHLNDSLTEFASHKDRHAKIGEGTIGIDAIAEIINHPKLRNLPFYLETPNELDGYAEEIKLLKSLRS